VIQLALEESAGGHAASPRGNPRPAVRCSRGQPLTTKPFAKGVGVSRISEAKPNVVLFVVMSSAADMRIIALVLSRGHFALVPAHDYIAGLIPLLHNEARAALSSLKTPPCWGAGGFRTSARGRGVASKANGMRRRTVPSSERRVFALAVPRQADFAPPTVSCALRILAFRGEVARPSASLPPKSEASLRSCRHRCHMKRGRFPAPIPR
jgi:hypothetical protein